MVRFFKRDMSKERKELSGEELINFFLWTIILVLPWVMSPYGYDSYYFPKAIFLWSVGLILLVLMIKELRKKNFKITKEIKIVFVFLGIIVISTIFSMDIFISIFGKDVRYEGFISYSIYIILFVLSTKYLKLNKNIINIYKISVFIMAIYGVFQFYNIDPVPRDPFHSIMKQSYGMIGHRNFFATYLFLGICLTMSLFIYRGNYVDLFYTSVMFAALIATLTRGVWGSFVVIAGLGFLTILKRKDALKRALIVFLCLSLVYTTLNVTKDGQVKNRVESAKNDIKNITEKSGSGRVYVWKTSLGVVVNHPILGSGPDTLMYSILEDNPERMEYWQKNFENTNIDKAHNEYIQIAANSGVFALLTYLVLISLILKRVIKNYNDDRYKIIGLMIVGYLVQAFFNISVVGVAPLFWILLGLSTNEEEVKKLRLN